MGNWGEGEERVNPKGGRGRREEEQAGWVRAGGGALRDREAQRPGAAEGEGGRAGEGAARREKGGRGGRGAEEGGGREEGLGREGGRGGGKKRLLLLEKFRFLLINLIFFLIIF